MVYHPDGHAMTNKELADWANVVHRIAGGRGNPFTENDFPFRLRGWMCDCPVDTDGISTGEFDLLPLYSSAVREGGKAYMACRKCGCHSHL